MVELFVVGALSALAFGFASRGFRALGARRLVEDDLADVGHTVAAQVARHLRRQSAVAMSLCAVVAGFVLVAYGVAYQVGGEARHSVREYGLVVTGAFLLGAVVALLVGWVSSRIGVQTALRVADSARRSIDEALVDSMRGGIVTGLLAQASATFTSALVVLGILAFYGGFRGNSPAALAEVVRTPLLLGGVALGAALGALLGQVGGGLLGRVAALGGRVGAGRPSAGSADSWAEAWVKPGAFAERVGEQVGDAAAYGTSGVASTMAELVASMLVGALVFQASPTFPSVTALVLFPLLVRAFGALAGWFGALVVRTDDTEAPAAALARGLYVAATLAAVATGGLATWLLGGHAARFAAAAGLGIVASIGLLFVVQYFTDPRSRSVRDVAKLARSGGALSTLRALLVAADATLVSTVLIAATFLIAYRLGMSTGVRHGGMFGVAMALGGLRGTSVYVSAMAVMGTVSQAASGFLAMTTSDARPAVQERTRQLGALGATAKTYYWVLRTISVVVAAFLMMAVLREWLAATGGAPAEFSGPSLWLGAGFGLVTVVAFARVLLGGVVRAGHELVGELQHRRDAVLGAESSVSGSSAAPVGVVAERSAEEACVEVVSRAGIRGIIAAAIIGVVVPLLVGVGLRLSSTGDRVRSSAEALVAFVIVATIAGGFGSLLFANAGSAWDNAKRYIEIGAHGGRHIRHHALRPKAAGDVGSSLGISEPVDATDSAQSDLNPAHLAAVFGDSIGDPLKGVVAPAVLALLETLALLLMVFSPFFT